jgi:hypothetical protein
MKLFFYKPKPFEPIIILVTKISTDEEAEKAEAWAHELFQILMDQNEATDKNILILSIIKDHKKSTINMIVPAVNSSPSLVERCQSNTKFLNSVIVETLQKSDTEFCIELTPEKVLIHSLNLNFMSLSKFYKIK